MSTERGTQQRTVEYFGFQWHVTDFCNLRCRHCYQDGFSRENDLDLDAVKAIARKIAEVQKDKEIHINLTGGEPMLRKDFFDILGFLMTIDNVAAVNIITNGLLLDRPSIKRLDKMPRLKEVKISIEGTEADVNDPLRGRGTFDKVMARVRSMVEESVKETFLMFTLGRYNYLALGRMLEFSRDLGVDGVIIERFVPWGRGAAIKNEYLKPEEWKAVLQTVIDFTNLAVAPDDILAYKAFRICFAGDIELEGALCNLGEESMALMPNGDVYPCRRFPSRVGNMLEDDFREVLLRLKLLRESIAVNVRGKCRTCRIEDCRGCRAIACALTGDFLAEDPQCFLIDT
jgi:radical SAM protein with 4Fe4S-binding SPASM domain